jgi:hypothetical protein
VLIVVGRGARDEEEVDASEEIQSMHGFDTCEGGPYLAFGNLSLITTKSSSYSTISPSGFVSGFSMYTPSPLRGSQPFTTFLAFSSVLDGCTSSAVGLGFLVEDMSSVTAL